VEYITMDKIIVLTQSRTGSHLLTEMIASRIGGQRLGELFNQKMKSLDESYQLMEDNSQNPHVIKLFYSDFLKIDDHERFWTSVSDYKLVGLVRADLEDLILSKLLSIITTVRQRVLTLEKTDTKLLLNTNGSRKQVSNLDVSTINVIYDPRFGRIIAAQIQEALALASAFTLYNIQKIYYYENLTGNPNVDIVDIGSDVPDGHQTLHQRIYPNKQFKRDRISNYEEFKSYFDGVIDQYRDQLAASSINWIY